MSRKKRQFTQISLFSVLLGGHYGGIVSVGEVKHLGNLAIATMDRLDGEMQMIDGVVYQACADGQVYLPGDDETVPFGTIADFSADGYVTAWFMWLLQDDKEAAKAFTGDKPELLTNPLYQDRKTDLSSLSVPDEAEIKQNRGTG